MDINDLFDFNHEEYQPVCRRPLSHVLGNCSCVALPPASMQSCASRHSNVPVHQIAEQRLQEKMQESG